MVVATPSAENYTLSIDLLYSQGSNGTADGCEVGCDNYWNFGNDSGGGGFTNNTEDKIDNPCEELKAQIDDLQKIMTEIGNELYSTNTESSETPTSDNENDSVIDTDFQE